MELQIVIGFISPGAELGNYVVSTRILPEYIHVTAVLKNL